MPLLRASVTLSRTLGDKDDLAWGLELLGVALAEADAHMPLDFSVRRRRCG